MFIGKKYKIDADPMNVTLYQKRTVGAHDGIPSHTNWQAIGYFATPKTALKELVKLKVKESELKDLKTIVEKMEDIYAMIDTLTRLPQRRKKENEW